MKEDQPLQPLDYCVAAVVLVVPVVIGIVFAYRDAKKVTRLEYLLGGQSLSILPVAMSTFVTFQSAVSLIGVPNEVYTYNTNFFYFFIGMSASYVFCCFTLIPLMYPLKVTSIYEYLYLRFQSQAVRMLSTALGCTQTTFYLAVALLSPALALQAVAEMPLWISILVVGGIGTFYTVIGGIKSVIWTDVFQTVIVFVGIFAIIIKGSMAVGGLDDAWTIAYNGSRISFDELSPDPRVRMSIWGAVLGSFFMWLSLAYNQSSLQRIRSLRNLRAAKIAFFLNAPFCMCYGTVLILVGIVTYAYFSHEKCDPYKGGFISNRNQIAPFFVINGMSDLPGMVGLYMATLACGSLSTLSSGINALAANTVEDFLERPLKNVSERTATIITKIAAAVYGILICCIAYGAQYLRGPVSQMANSVFAAFGTPVLGMFLIGCAVPWSTKYGALAGGVVSLAFNLWITLGNRLYGRKPPTLPPADTVDCVHHNASVVVDNSHISSNIFLTTKETPESYSFTMYDISYEWYAVYGIIISLVVGLVVSLLTRDRRWKRSRHLYKLVFPISRRLWSLDEEINEDSSNVKQSLEVYVNNSVSS